MNSMEVLSATNAPSWRGTDIAPSLKTEWGWRFLAGLWGAVVGLAAPGIDLFYLPWVAMSSLLLLTALAREPWSAAGRGFCFGTTYNLVYLSWFLAFRPVFCEGNFVFSPGLMAAGFWILVSAWQGLFISVFPALLRALPLVGGWLPMRHQGRWHWPSFIVIPLLWVVVDRLLNTVQLHGFPWSSLHYTQYKQLAVLQVASVIGGVGISAWIMLVAATFAAIFAFSIIALRPALRPLLAPLTLGRLPLLAVNCGFTLLLSLALLAWGNNRLQQEEKLLSGKPKEVVTALQVGLSSKIHKADGVSIVDKYVKMAVKSPYGCICVFPEWALPLNFTASREYFKYAAVMPQRVKQDWIVGAFDKDGEGRTYNSVCALSGDGRVLPVAYHKRYLVPVGEYTPTWIRDTPVGVLLYGYDKKYADTSSGTEAVVFNLGRVKLSPVICFENFMPQLSAESVRAGAELLVDCSDNSWFSRSILSDQMVSFSVMRAVENHRSFVFATAFGPSTIVDSSGHILRQAPRDAACAISCAVPVERDITPYTRWCF